MSSVAPSQNLSDIREELEQTEDEWLQDMSQEHVPQAILLLMRETWTRCQQLQSRLSEALQLPPQPVQQPVQQPVPVQMPVQMPMPMPVQMPMQMHMQVPMPPPLTRQEQDDMRARQERDERQERLNQRQERQERQERLGQQIEQRRGQRARGRLGEERGGSKRTRSDDGRGFRR